MGNVIDKPFNNRQLELDRETCRSNGPHRCGVLKLNKCMFFSYNILNGQLQNFQPQVEIEWDKCTRDQ